MTSDTQTAPAAARPRLRPRLRLRGRARKIALTAHVLAAVGWFGVAVAAAFCGLAAATTTNRALAHALYRTIETIPWLSVPAGLVAVAAGLLLGTGTGYGLVRYWWVVAKAAIAAAVIATDAVLVGRFARHAAVSGSAGRLLVPAIAHVAMLAAAVVLAVFKPGGVTPWRRRARTSAD